ncbi:MAG: RHS repeat-associated core domain-containing protein [Myxococcota bacterium]
MSGYTGASLSRQANLAKPAAVPSPPPPPLIAHQGSPGLDCMIDVVNSTAAPFQALASPEEGKAKAVADAIGGVLGVIGMPETLLDTGFAVLTAPLAKMMPALPAVTILGMHVGPPHGHLHPPSFTPPATPAPVPLPSLGVLLGAGAFSVLLGGLPAARAGDIGIAAACGGFCPPFEVHTGSSSVFLGGSRAARMGDITRHCNPVAMAGLGLVMGIAGAVGGIAGAIASGSPTAAAQAIADVAVLALKQLVGKDIAVPPAYGTLIGPPVGNVLIGGFPCPPLLDALKGLLKKLKALAKAKPKASKGDNAPCGSASEPVDLVTGAAYDYYSEFVSGGLFEWHRHYTTERARQDGPLGFGSRHSYQATLRVRLHHAILTKWDGEQVEFPRFERGSNVTRAQGYVLARVDRQTYRVSYLDEPELEFFGDRFAGDLQLVRVRKKEGELVISRDSVGRIEAFTETNFKQQTQRRFELRYADTGRILQLVEIPLTAHGHWTPEPVLLRYYRYSNSGDLLESTDTSGYPQRFEYDVNHRVTKYVTQLGFAFTYRYDSRGRVVESTGQDGLWWAKFEYPKPGLTVFTQGDNARYECHYDTDGAVTSIVYPDGGKLTRVRGKDGRVDVEIDPAGRKMRRLYDKDGAHYARLDSFGHLLPPAIDAPIAPDPFARTLPTKPLQWLLGDLVPPPEIATHASDLTDASGAPQGRTQLWPISWNGPNPSLFAGIPAQHAYIARAIFTLRDGSRSPARPPQIERNARGQRIQETDERGATRRWQYDIAGNLIAQQDRDGRVHQFTVASANLRGSQVNDVGQTLQYKYSSLAEVTEVIDPFGNVTRYDYDQRKRLTRVHRHGRVRDEYLYDVASHFIEKRDGDGNVLFTNEPHANHLVGKRNLASGGFHQFDYDARGRVTEASTQDYEVKLTYLAGEWPTSDLRDGKGIQHTRSPDADHSRILGKFLQHRALQSTHSALLDPTGKQTTLVFEQGLVRRTCPNGTIETLQYDPEGRLLARLVYRSPRSTGALAPTSRTPSSVIPGSAAMSSNTPISSVPSSFATPNTRRPESWATRYGYTLEGDLVRVDDTIRGTTQFEVDKAHRLAAEVTPKQERLIYWQDAADNLLSKPGLPGLRLLPGNLLAASFEERFEHNKRDHLALRKHQDGTQVRYLYDSFDMLVAIEREAADGTISKWQATYDALGRRITATVAGKTREFFWDYERLAAEIQPNSHLRVYQYASRTARIPIGFTDYDSPDADPSTGRSYFVFSDPVGMPLCIENEEGQIAWWAERIDPYGAIQIAPGATVEYNLRWPGHYYDPETGLHYNRWRYYDPALGRYLQSDPIGHAGSPVNLYAYCVNPLVDVDLLGLNGGGGGCNSNHGDDHGKSNGENDGQDKPPHLDPDSETPPKYKAEHNGEPVNPKTGLTKSQEADFRRRIDNAPNEQAANDVRFERNSAKRANREPPQPPMDRGDWDASNQRLRDNSDRGRVHEDNALNDLGVQNNNRNTDADGNSRDPVTYPHESGEGETRPDGVSDTSVVDVKSVPPGRDPDGNPRTVYQTDQLRSQKSGAAEDGKQHVTVISSDGPANDTRPSNTLGNPDKGGSDAVLHRDNTTGQMSQWDPTANDGKGGWEPITNDAARSVVGGTPNG